MGDVFVRDNRYTLYDAHVVPFDAFTSMSCATVRSGPSRILSDDVQSTVKRIQLSPS